jgi:hypothetical protein
MSPEIRMREQEPKSEICADPEILLNKVRELSEHPQDKTGRMMFREWLLKDWKGINEFMLQFPPKRESANDGYTIRSANLGNYNIYRNSNSEFLSGGLQEDAPHFLSFEGIDRTIITLYHQSNKTKECKNKGGKDVWMDIVFVADSEKRDDLIGLSIRVNNDSHSDNFGGVKEYFEVKVSPELEVAKLK